MQDKMQHMNLQPSALADGADDVVDPNTSALPEVESNVAVITFDFAMQNVALQMGLRLLTAGGLQVKVSSVHRKKII